MDMTEEEHAKMSSYKTKPSEEVAPKQEAPKEEMKDDIPSEKPSSEEKTSVEDDAKKMGMTEEEHAKMGSKKD